MGVNTSVTLDQAGMGSVFCGDGGGGGVVGVAGDGVAGGSEG